MRIDGYAIPFITYSPVCVYVGELSLAGAVPALTSRNVVHASKASPVRDRTNSRDVSPVFPPERRTPYKNFLTVHETIDGRVAVLYQTSRITHLYIYPPLYHHDYIILLDRL